jgi:hypothetical protein
MTTARPLLLGLMLALAAATGPARPMSADEVRHQIILESVKAHGGYCVCPWQKDRKGKACGIRSLYNRGGGYPPQCYPQDVDDDAVQAWLVEHSEPR